MQTVSWVTLRFIAIGNDVQLFFELQSDAQILNARIGSIGAVRLLVRQCWHADDQAKPPLVPRSIRIVHSGHIGPYEGLTYITSCGDRHIFEVPSL